MLLNHISTEQFIGILQNFPENTFSNELGLASILLETNSVSLSFSVSGETYRTFCMQDTDPADPDSAQQVVRPLNEAIDLHLNYISENKKADSLKAEALNLLFGSIIQAVSGQVTIAALKNQNHLILRKSFHDLKNPLTSISLHAELIKKIVKKQDKVELMADKIIANAHKMIQNMNTVLDVQKAK